jgi:protein SCO1/2
VISAKIVRGQSFARHTLIRYTRAVSIPSPNSTTYSAATTSRAAAAASRAGAAVQRLLAGLFGRPVFWVVFVGIAFVLPITRVVRTKLPPRLPIFGTISDFELVDQNDRPYGTSELKGRVWLASAIQTASGPQAEKLAGELGKIQNRVVNLGPAFHMVTLGLDPAADTQPALLEFTRHRRVSPRMWSFLSGNGDAVHAAQQALGLHAEGAAPRTGPMDVVLVDAQMRVRGRYDLSDPDAIDTLLYHTGLLVNRGD